MNTRSQLIHIRQYYHRAACSTRLYDIIYHTFSSLPLLPSLHPPHSSHPHSHLHSPPLTSPPLSSPWSFLQSHQREAWHVSHRLPHLVHIKVHRLLAGEQALGTRSHYLLGSCDGRQHPTDTPHSTSPLRSDTSHHWCDSVMTCGVSQCQQNTLHSH